jgi:glycosyltransferase involved in cell wall biosynthesis
MKILVISPRPPYPLHGGFEVRVYPLFRELSRRNDLTLLCRTYRDLDTNTIEKLDSVFSHVEMFRVQKLQPEDRRRRSIFSRLTHLVAPPPEYHDTSTYCEELDISIKQKLESGEFDIVQVLGLNMMRYFTDFEKYAAVCDAVDDYSLFCYRTIWKQTRAADKIRFFMEWIATRRFEGRYVSRFKEVVLVSPVDARVMKSVCPSAKVSIIPNGVDSDFFKPGCTGTDRPIVVFTGVMDYEPNVTGALYFIESILPQVQKSVPGVSFKIVGRDPDPKLVELSHRLPNVEVTGFVEDMRPHFDEALVYVSPLRSGAGIKNKILEAWSMGKPVVATRMSCDGLSYEDGHDILIADKPAEFADAVVRLLIDPELRSRLGQNGRQRVVNQYSWRVQAERFQTIYERIVESSS